MLYETTVWGMTLAWWIVWILVLIWIFIVPYNILGERKKRDSPLDILKKRLALGHISNAEYLEKKKIIEKEV